MRYIILINGQDKPEQYSDFYDLIDRVKELASKGVTFEVLQIEELIED